MSAAQLPDDSRCTYPFKQCDNPRAIKKDGMPHKLCESHRARAKEYQTNLARRKKEADELQRQINGTEDSRRLTFEDIDDLLNNGASLRVVCSEDDMKAIEALLSECEGN